MTLTTSWMVGKILIVASGVILELKSIILFRRKLIKDLSTSPKVFGELYI